jgi:parallel beta-helix repeat protein
MNRISLFLCLLVAVLLSAVPVLADDFYVIAGSGKVGTPINSVPYTISSPGMYYLNGNLTSTLTSGRAISINASDVTLDLMGFTLTGPGKTSGLNDGIQIQALSSNVEIRNGSIKNCGGWGIYADSGIGIRVIGLRVRDTGSTGISLGGIDHLVMGCSVVNAGFFGIRTDDKCMIKGNQMTGNDFYGISAGSGCTVTGNVCSSNGILTLDNCTITNNTTQGLTSGTNCTLAQNTIY